MSKLLFKPNLQKRRSYSLVPDEQNLRRGLDIILGWGQLEVGMRLALERRGWQERTVREGKYQDVLDEVLKAHGLKAVGGARV
ncbi:MAG: hypothetical protein SFU83_22190 [Meiothermus sp.]|nr:hypothetical protein [Meiothermus sp.]